MVFPYFLNIKRKSVNNKLRDYAKKFNELNYRPVELRDYCQSIDAATKVYREKTETFYGVIKSWFPSTKAFIARKILATNISILSNKIEEIHLRAIIYKLDNEPKKRTTKRTSTHDYKNPKKNIPFINDNHHIFGILFKPAPHVINNPTLEQHKIGLRR